MLMFLELQAELTRSWMRVVETGARMATSAISAGSPAGLASSWMQPWMAFNQPSALPFMPFADPFSRAAALWMSPSLFRPFPVAGLSPFWSPSAQSGLNWLLPANNPWSSTAWTALSHQWPAPAATATPLDVLASSYRTASGYATAAIVAPQPLSSPMQSLFGWTKPARGWLN